MQRDFRALGQVVQHVALQAPQHERRDHAAQARLRFGIGVAFDGHDEIAAELLLRTEQARIQVGEQRMQIHQVVLYRRAGGDHPKVRTQLPCRSTALGGGILDGLGFVQHHGVPIDGADLVDVVLHQAVGGDEQIEAAGFRQQQFALGGRACVGFDLKGGRETPRFVLPIGDYRRRCHHQCRALGRSIQQHGQRLHGFAQSHVVG